MRIVFVLLTLALAGCSQPAPAEGPLADDTKQQVLAWVASLPAGTGAIDKPTLERTFKIALQQQPSGWAGERLSEDGLLRIATEQRSDGQEAHIGIGASSNPKMCVLTTGELVSFASSHGYEARFSNVPGRPHFWNLTASTATSGISLLVLGRPSMTNDTKDTACVASIDANANNR